jgi:hypothetical protein
MSVRTNCPACGEAYDIPDAIVNRTLLCTNCRRQFVATMTHVDSAGEPHGVRTERREPPARPGPDTIADQAPQGAITTQPSIGRIGRFELRAAIGEGSFGRVYRGYDPLLDREVAIKVPMIGLDQPQMLERFLREAKAPAKLRHPNIVTVYETGRDGDQSYIVTEFVEGVPLSARLKQDPPSFRQAASWVRDLALALAYAHEEGIIHRDIKPANIMIDRRGRAQLMDFGLAKRLLEEEKPGGSQPNFASDPDLTRAGAILGTPAYMAPEQARGEQSAVGPHSDQYSIGVVLYELLTGEKPFRGTTEQVLARVRSPKAKPPLPRRLRPAIPPELEAICLKAMAKRPNARYAGTADLAVDLQHWLKDEPIRARLRTFVGPWWTIKHVARTHPAWVVGISLTLLFLILATLGLWKYHELEESVKRVQLEILQRRCDQLRQEGTDLCGQGKLPEGVLYLAEAYVTADKLARRTGDLGMREGVSRELRQHAGKLPGAEWQQVALLLLDGTVDRPDEGLLGQRSALLPLAGFVAQAAFLDEETLLTVSGNQARLWDARTGLPRGEAPGPGRYTPDGRVVLLHNKEAGGLQLVDVRTGNPLGPPFQAGGKLLLSPNGRSVATVDATTWKIWDGVTGQCLGPQHEKDQRFMDVFFDGKGDRLMAQWNPPQFSRGPNTIPWLQLWDARTARPLGRKFAFGDARFSPAGLSPGGDLFLVQKDGEIQAWEAESGDVKHRFRATKPGDFLGSHVAWAPDGRSFVTFDVARDSDRAGFQVAQVWGIGTWQVWGGPVLPHPGIQQAVYSRDGKTLVTLSRHTAKLWDPASGDLLGLPVPCPKASRTLISPAGSQLVTVAEKETRLWPVQRGVIDRAAAVGLWARVVSGMSLVREPDAADGGPEVWQARRLDADEASACRQQLEELVGLNAP